MIGASIRRGITPAPLHRLSALAPLDDLARRAIVRATEQSGLVRARREMMAESREIAGARLVVEGWAARVRILPDGRRQFLSFLLPGDLIGLCRQPRPVAVSSVVALTDVAACPLPAATLSPTLAEAYDVSRALEEAYLLSQITRLGRLNAQERIADLLLELFERLALAGLVRGNAFDVPLTQEVLADALGLTPVHINRMLQLARQQGDLDWKGGQVTLHDPAALARKVGRTPVRVSTAQG